jgi:hypothetical protein
MIDKRNTVTNIIATIIMITAIIASVITIVLTRDLTASSLHDVRLANALVKSLPGGLAFVYFSKASISLKVAAPESAEVAPISSNNLWKNKGMHTGPDIYYTLTNV